MIRAVIFDVGGVLIRTVDPSPRRALEERLGLAPGEAERLVFNSPHGAKAQHGIIRSAKLWAWVQTQLGLDEAGLAAFQREFFAGDVLDETLVTLVRELRKRYQTAILSNYMDDLLENVTKRYPMADAFDVIVGSAYEGVTKPDAAIFERVLARLERAPQEAVFIDDLDRNIAGAQAVGLATIHYTPGLDVAAALADLGVT